jgi:hypothetical protein
MNHKNPVSGDGDGVFILGIHNIYEWLQFFKYWKENLHPRMPIFSPF